MYLLTPSFLSVYIIVKSVLQNHLILRKYLYWMFSVHLFLLRKKIAMKNIVSLGGFFFRCKITQTEILFVLKLGLPALKEDSQDNMINWPMCSVLAHQGCTRIDMFVQYGLML